MEYKEKINVYWNKIKEISKVRRNQIIALLVLLGIIAMVATILALNSKENDSVSKQDNFPKLYSTLLFTPNKISLDKRQVESTNINLNVGDNTAAEVSFAITYDPKAIDSFDIKQELDPKSALSNSFVVTKSIVNPKGRIEMTLSLKPNAIEQIGSGNIAKIFFVPKKDFVGQTTVFFDETNVTSKSNTQKGVFAPGTNALIIVKGK